MIFEEFGKAYSRYTRRKKLMTLYVAVAAILVSLLEIALGPYDIGFFEAYRVFIDHILGNDPVSTLDDYVVWKKNTPRAIAVIAIGAGLGVCGAAMQSALRNPLADPYMTGIASGANFGVSLAAIAGIILIPAFTGDLGVISNAFILALVPAIVIISISGIRHGSNSTTMILVGIAVMYVFSAFTTMLKLSAPTETFASVYAWSLGTLGSVGWTTLPYVIVATVFGIILLYHMSVKLNLLSCSEDLAVSSGINPKNVRLISIAVVSLVTATLVCFTGTIGFVGLVAPHVMRIFLGSDNVYLIPATAACGAFVLAAADCIAIEITSTGLPVGVITSLIGGPLFIYILIKQHKNAWS